MQRDIDNGNLVLANPGDVFDLWQQEGVLILNTALTYTDTDEYEC